MIFVFVSAEDIFYAKCFTTQNKTRAIASHKKMHHKKSGTLLWTFHTFIWFEIIKKTAVQLSTCTSMVLLWAWSWTLYSYIFFIVAVPIHHGTATLRQILFPLYRRFLFCSMFVGNCYCWKLNASNHVPLWLMSVSFYYFWYKKNIQIIIFAV